MARSPNCRPRAPRTRAPGAAGPAEVLAVIPFRQVTERGYACNDDGEPILALTAERRAALPVKEALDRCPTPKSPCEDGGFDIDDEDYEEIVGSPRPGDPGR